MIFYTSAGKSKKRKPNAKQRELQASWESMIKKHAPKTPKKSISMGAVASFLGNPARRETPNIPSLPFTGGPCTKKEQQMYTGTAMKGIGTLHKSNAVPIFTDEEAIDIAKMRR
jgi:hypothetical protein